MKWLGLAIGILLGMAMKKLDAMVSLALVGFIIGTIIDLVRGSTAKAAVQERFEKLERAVAQIETRLGAIERRRAQEAQEASEELGRTGERPMPAQWAEVVSDLPPLVAPVPPVTQAPPVTPAQAGAQAARLDPGLRRDDNAAGAQAARLDPGLRRDDKSAPPNVLIAFLTGGNAIARVGLLILFFGFAFLLKYAVDRNLFPPELRVGAVAAAGLALLIGGWRLRARREAYALGLQGAGVAVLYLTTFAALRLYHLLPPTAAFVLLAAIAVLSAVLAVKQDALVLAVFGTGGGFLAPILASTGEGSHVALFSYYLLLNAGIALVALKKSWRSLNIMGFAFTFFIGLAWGDKFYKPEFLATTEPFLIAFFLLYVAIAVLNARRDAPDMRRLVDGTIVFGVPLAAFGLQAALLKNMELGLAFSCVGASALYLALTAALKKSRQERFADLAECFLALGVVFATLAIPFALDARWTSALWGLEGAAIVWVGLRQQRRVATGFGLALEIAAGVSFWLGYVKLAPGFPWIDAAFIGALILAIAGTWTSRLLGRDHALPNVKPLAGPAFVWGVCWWFFAAHHDFQAFLPLADRAAAYVALVAATAWFFSILALRMQWMEARWPALALMPTLAIFFLLTMTVKDHAFADAGWAAWPFAFASLAWALRKHEEHAERAWRDVMHAGSAMLLAAVGAGELHWLAARYAAPHTAWTIASYAVAPAVVLMLIAARRADNTWPVNGNERAYRVGAGVALAIFLVAWTVVANVTHDGRSDPLPYMPVLNALDLAHTLVILAVASIALAWRRTGVAPDRNQARPATVAAGIAAFVWLNAILLRTIHHYAGIPYIVGPMLESVLVQAALSIFWTVLALALMLFATRNRRRATWVTGAALMAVVVVKLFVLDLSHVTGIERIVSFIAVGLLMLLVGWFAPVPPRAAALVEAREEGEEAHA